MTFPSETTVTKILTPRKELEECEFCMMERQLKDKNDHRKYKAICQDENGKYFVKCLKCHRESSHYTMRSDAKAAWERSLNIARGVTKCILAFG